MKITIKNTSVKKLVEFINYKNNVKNCLIEEVKNLKQDVLANGEDNVTRIQHDLIQYKEGEIETIETVIYQLKNIVDTIIEEELYNEGK